jgi:membrane protein DedA with SNARE-associated domain
MSERRFLVADGLSALITTPLMVWLGFTFGDQMERLFGNVRQVQWVLLGGMAATLVVAVVARWMRRRAVAADPAVAEAAGNDDTESEEARAA